MKVCTQGHEMYCHDLEVYEFEPHSDRTWGV